MATNLLEVENLKKSYGANQAVRGVSFSVKSGEIFGLLGPNGAGKTSIISTIVTLEVPTSGRVLVNGFDPTIHPEITKSSIGFVAQEVINHGFFSVEEILKFHSGYFGIWNNQERIHYLLHRLSLFEHKDKKVKQLSGGMKRRLMIAKALVHDPKILLLDEPTAGVDIELRENLWKFVSELRDQGMSILLTTHYLEEAESLCDRVGILSKGELKYVGQTREIIEMLAQREIHVTLKNNLSQKIEHPFLTSQIQNKLIFTVPAKVSVSEIFSQCSISVQELVDIRVEEASLEDAFLAVLHSGMKAEANL